MALQHHMCAVCKRSDCRLYRSYGSFLRAEDIVCNAHLPVRESVIVTAWMVPLVEAEDGSVWGYGAVPERDKARWYSMPESDATAPTWQAGWTMPGAVS